MATDAGTARPTWHGPPTAAPCTLPPTDRLHRNESERNALPPQDGLEDDEDCLDDYGDGCANAYCDSYGDHNQR